MKSLTTNLSLQGLMFAYFGLASLLLLAYPAWADGNSHKLPIVINTWAFTSATQQAWETLRESKSTAAALDAVEQGCATCEREQCDGTVGFGGSPDEEGETTLDALIMDGGSMELGAVASLRHVKQAISTARLVMHHTRHSLLAGLQATQFANDMGAPLADLTTKHSTDMHKEWMKDHCQPNFRRRVVPDPSTSCGPYSPPPPTTTTTSAQGRAQRAQQVNGTVQYGAMMDGRVQLGEGNAQQLQGSMFNSRDVYLRHVGDGYEGSSSGSSSSSTPGTEDQRGSPDAGMATLQRTISSRGVGRGGGRRGRLSGGVAGGQAEGGWPSRYSHDTIAMAAIDSQGNIAAGCSTNGANNKVPGRVGDCSVAGGGAYADSEVGACGATGDGDVHLRFLPCYQVVESMRQGMKPQEAAEDAIKRIARKVPGYVGAVFAVDKEGSHGGACYGWKFQYAFRDSKSEAVKVVEVEPLSVEVVAMAGTGQRQLGCGFHQLPLFNDES